MVGPYDLSLEYFNCMFCNLTITLLLIYKSIKNQAKYARVVYLSKNFLNSNQFENEVRD